LKCRIAKLVGDELYCSEGESKLEFYEAIYKAKKGTLKIIKEGKELSWLEALLQKTKNDQNAWIIFSVYYDLIERGRKTREGPFPNTLELISDGKPYAIVFVVEETVRFKVEQIAEWLDISRRLGKDSIIAIVDKHGDVSYYIMERFA
jgi:tRNA-intron endonuclease